MRAGLPRSIRNRILMGAVLILGQGGKIGVNLGGHRGNLGMGRLPILRGPPGAV